LGVRKIYAKQVKKQRTKEPSDRDHHARLKVFHQTPLQSKRSPAVWLFKRRLAERL
jgi:hypothetical protein